MNEIVPVSGGTDSMAYKDNGSAVPIWEKTLLTLKEAAAYSGIGINRLRELSNAKDCDFVIFVGSKRMIKRRQLDDFLAGQYSI